ncbi:MAG: hypothetical protein GY847_17135 [Proteobacteria bacterium]|nr:hypothetical protein [Pseudomonadota bacterium]
MPKLVAIALGLGIQVITALGCNGTNGSFDYDGPINSCRYDRDCPDKTVCNSGIMRCVKAGVAEDKEYFLKVIPKAETEIPEQVFKVTLDGDGKVREKLEIFERVDVEVERIEGGITNLRSEIYAQMVIIDKGIRIPGDSPRITVYSFTRVNEKLKMKLLPGIERYFVKLIPQGDMTAECPPSYYDNITITDEGKPRNSDGSDLSLSMQEAPDTMIGVIKRGDQPVNGLTVEALSQDTGQILSTRAVTGCLDESDIGRNCGEFQIVFNASKTDDHDSASYRFLLRISKPNESWYPVTTILIEHRYDPDVEPIVGDIHVELDPIELEPLGAMNRYNAQVSRENIGYDWVPDCLVVFESEDVAGGTAVRRAYTNEGGWLVNMLEGESGYVGIDLYPGNYRITIVPPDQSLEAADDDAVDLSNSFGETFSGQVFSLKSRPRISGRIIVDDVVISYGSVTAVPLHGEPNYARSSFSTIGAEKLYTIWPDIGRYRLTAESHPKSGYAWGVKDINTNKNLRFYDIKLTYPVVARAELSLVHKENSDVWEDALEGAIVEWYEEIGNRAFIVGRSIVEPGGRIIALLPESK